MKASCDDPHPRTLYAKARQAATERALAALLDGPLTSAEVGAAVWENAGLPRRGRVSATTGGGDYAAQMLLGRMRAAGLVRTTDDVGVSRWELTDEGRAHRLRSITPTAGE